MNATQRLALAMLEKGQRLSSGMLARQGGVTTMDAARALVDLQTAGLVTNYGGTYALRRPR